MVSTSWLWRICWGTAASQNCKIFWIIIIKITQLLNKVSLWMRNPPRKNLEQITIPGMQMYWSECSEGWKFYVIDGLDKDNFHQIDIYSVSFEQVWSEYIVSETIIQLWKGQTKERNLLDQINNKSFNFPYYPGLWNGQNISRWSVTSSFFIFNFRHLSLSSSIIS